MQHRRAAEQLEPPRTPQVLAPADEAALLSRIRSGDAAAFETIFRSYAESCYRTAYRYVRDAAVARDLAQDVLLRLWEQRAALDIDRSLRHYLHVATRNLAFNHLRRGRIEALAGDRLRREGAVAPGTRAVTVPRDDERLDAERLRAVVAAAVDTLPERQRMVLTLRWRSQLTYPEIAECMGISVKGVENHLSRAFKALRSRLAGSVGYSAD